MKSIMTYTDKVRDLQLSKYPGLSKRRKLKNLMMKMLSFLQKTKNFKELLETAVLYYFNVQ